MSTNSQVLIEITQCRRGFLSREYERPLEVARALPFILPVQLRVLKRAGRFTRISLATEILFAELELARDRHVAARISFVEVV